jgi:hypothetical protein
VSWLEVNIDTSEIPTPLVGCLDVENTKSLCRILLVKVRFIIESSSLRQVITTGRSPRFTGLSNDRIFGYQVPLDIGTCKNIILSVISLTNPLQLPDATLLFLGDQITGILYFFLSRNLRIARDRAWDQTLTSRGKGPDFWGSYVEGMSWIYLMTKS